MYKTIVVHIDGSTWQDSRVSAAAQLASQFEAHLVGAAMTGLSWAAYVVLGLPEYPEPVGEAFAALRNAAQDRLAAFEERARGLGVASFESRLAEDEASHALLLQARFADLVVLGQESPADPPPAEHGLPERVVLEGARPVLVVPDAWKGQLLGGTAIVGWDGSAPAVHAITAALPLLRRARAVMLVLVNPGSEIAPDGAQPGADMGAYLARHGVPVEVVVEHAADGAGEALMARAEAVGASLIVAGAFGHTRYREWVLGGATRDLLDRSRVPVLFAH